MKRVLSLSVLLCFGLAHASLASPQWVLDPGKSKVKFLAIGNPSALKIEGQGASPEGQLSIVEKAGKADFSGRFSFPLDSLDTGIDKRTSHMKKFYLEVEKYPRAELNITEMRTASPFTAGFKSRVPFKGLLSLHGQSKPIEGVAEIERSPTDAAGNIQFKIKLTDFGIKIPSFLGITVAEDVDVAVDLAGSYR